MRVKSFEDVDRALEQLRGGATAAITDGHQLDAVELSTDTTKVPHKLGRRVRGYLVVGRSAAETVYDANNGKLDLATNLHLVATGDVTVSLWVY